MPTMNLKIPDNVHNAIVIERTKDGSRPTLHNFTLGLINEALKKRGVMIKPVSNLKTK